MTLTAPAASSFPIRRIPAKAARFVLIAMGKHGARELNYSSDVDLIALHDPAER